MTVLALDAHNLGIALGALMIPLIGLTLLIVGLVEQTRSRRRPPMPPAYPGQPSSASHFGPQYLSPPPGYGSSPPPAYPPAAYAPSAPPYPPPPGHWPQPQRPKPRGKGLIVAGAVILGLSLLGGLARTGQSSRMSENSTDRGHGRLEDQSLMIGQCVADDEFGQRAAPSPVDCNDLIATMELASRGGADADCPDGKGRDDT